MRRWVEYKDGRVITLDKNRLLKAAIAFQKACEDYKNQCGVGAVARYYKPYLDAALEEIINFPVMERLPYTGEMRDRLLPLEFERVLMDFRQSLESRPAVYGILDADTLLHHRDEFMKEENSKTYILEYFEDNELPNNF